MRGGVCERKKMQEQAVEEFDVCGIYSISAASEAGWTLEQIALANKRDNGKIRKTTVGKLRSIGCEVTPPKGPYKHVNIILPQPPTTADWDALEGVLDLAEPNPYREQRP
jgi:hypothetical protein